MSPRWLALVVLLPVAALADDDDGSPPRAPGEPVVRAMAQASADAPALRCARDAQMPATLRVHVYVGGGIAVKTKATDRFATCFSKEWDGAVGMWETGAYDFTMDVVFRPLQSQLERAFDGLTLGECYPRPGELP